MWLKLGLREKRCLYEVVGAADCFSGYSASSVRCCLMLLLQKEYRLLVLLELLLLFKNDGQVPSRPLGALVLIQKAQ